MHSLMFPTTIVDDFLHEPFQYVKLANALQYERDKDGRWPGLRTENLVINYPDMVHRVVKKIMSLYYNLYCFEQEYVNWHVTAYFQKVSSNYNKGWIHSDIGNQLTSIIYFCESGLGTSIFRPKEILNFKGIINSKEKYESYKNIEKINELSRYREENNNQFIKTITVDSCFNRLLCFEGGHPHGVDNFENEDNNLDRLTLILFISKIVPANCFPIERSKFSL